ncbi:AMP-binding enzyme-domain-containing protein, partial [Phakopsora pachyrhizi]
ENERGRNNEPDKLPRSPSCSPCYDTEANLPPELIGPEEYGSPTLWDCFLRGYHYSDSSPCMGTHLESTNHKSAVPSQVYSWLSYGEVYQKISALSTGLREIISMRTSNPMKADVEVGLLQIRVAICLPNSPIWTISEYACYHNSSVVVSINEQSNSKRISKIINQTRPAVILPTAEKFKLLIDHGARELVILEGNKTITLPKVPTLDDLNLKQSEFQFEGDDYTYRFNQSSSTEADWSFGSRSQTFEVYHNTLSKDPIYVIIDFPKNLKTNQAEATELGVVMYNIKDVEGIGSAKSRNESYQNCGIKEVDDVLKFELQNSLDLFLKQLLKLFTKVEPLVSIESYFLQKAIEEKVKVLKQSNGEKVWLWNKFVLGYLRESLGRRLKWIVSGTSALTNHFAEMLSASLSVKISEGYGLTETCLAASILLIDSLGILSNDGDVGKPLPCYEIKLKDVEGIYTKDDKPFARGQIFVRGHNLFKGNFIPGTQTEDERIHSPLDSSGWFGTGDIGYFDETGGLHLVD